MRKNNNFVLVRRLNGLRNRYADFGLSRLRADVLLLVMDRREHHRVQLRLTARLRWTTPFGQKTELCETLNVSRDAILVPCREAHAPGMPLWVTFPYDALASYDQPEILARVVRSAEAAEGELDRGPAAALRFEIAPHPVSNGNGRPRGLERRTSARRRLALPIHVRPGDIPWFEEAMTVDVSADGLLFLSSREYEPGHPLFVSFEPSASVPWLGAKEFRSIVVRAERMPQTPALAVAIRRVR